jgi:hypothetical protein
MVVARSPQQPGPPLWLALILWCVRMAFLAVLFAWIGRSFVLLEGQRDVYAAFQQGLFLVPDTLALAWQAVLEFTAPLRDRLFPSQPVFIGVEATPEAPAYSAISVALSPALIQSCVWIAGAQALVTLWALIARSDAARMWDGPGALAVLEPRARVVFYGLPLALAAYEAYRVWEVSTGEALLIAAFTLILRLFPWLMGLPFWIAEEVLGLNFASLRTLSFIPAFLPRKGQASSKPVTPAPDAPRPDYPSSLALFGLKPDCSPDDAMDAYRAHLRMNHPGRGGASEQLKMLNAAFETIKRQRGWA